MRKPKYGDQIMLVSEHEDGHWCNGVVNAVHADGTMFVVSLGHAKSQYVLLEIMDHTSWRYCRADERVELEVKPYIGPGAS